MYFTFFLAENLCTIRMKDFPFPVLRQFNSNGCNINDISLFALLVDVTGAMKRGNGRNNTRLNLKTQQDECHFWQQLLNHPPFRISTLSSLRSTSLVNYPKQHVSLGNMCPTPTFLLLMRVFMYIHYVCMWMCVHILIIFTTRNLSNSILY